MNPQRFTQSVTTDAAGAATAYFPDGLSNRPGSVTGVLISIEYTPDGSTPYTSGAVDFAFTKESTGQAVLSKTDVAAAFANAPGQATHDNAGTAQAPLDYFVFANDRLKLVIAQGGNTKTGSFTVTFA